VLPLFLSARGLSPNAETVTFVPRPSADNSELS
jgi:hypothetical protein